jgi:hypothetical protein
LTWEVQKINAVCTDIKIPYKATKEWQQWGLLTADRHIDNQHTDLKLQKYHLDQAKEREAFVLDFGDLFDAMQGKEDRRSDKGDLRPENKTGSYLNSLVEFAHDFLEPYKENLAIISEGNHETAVTDRHEYSLLDGLIYALHVSGSSVVRGGYRGYIRFRFEHEAGGSRMTRIGYYHHGSGGGGPVTKGVIQANRKSSYLSNADYVFTGHIHEQWVFPVVRSKLLNSGEEITETQYHVQIPTYKEEFTMIPGGFHHKTGKPPKPIGAWWVRFYYSNRTGRIEASFTEADK